jgi:hypothetical protein
MALLSDVVGIYLISITVFTANVQLLDVGTVALLHPAFSQRYNRVSKYTAFEM